MVWSFAVIAASALTMLLSISSEPILLSLLGASLICAVVVAVVFWWTRKAPTADGRLKPGLNAARLFAAVLTAVTVACIIGTTSYFFPVLVVGSCVFVVDMIYVGYLLVSRWGRGAATLFTAFIIAFLFTPTGVATEGGLLICPAWFLLFVSRADRGEIGTPQQMWMAAIAGAIFISSALIMLVFQEIGRLRKRKR